MEPPTPGLLRYGSSKSRNLWPFYFSEKINWRECSHQLQLALRCSRKFLGHNNLQLCRSNAASEHDLFFLAQMHMLLQHTLCACTHDEGSSSLTYIILHNSSYFALSICKTPCWSLASTGRITVVFRRGCNFMFNQSWGYQKVSYWIYETKVLRFNFHKIASWVWSHAFFAGILETSDERRQETLLEACDRDDFLVWA